MDLAGWLDITNGRFLTGLLIFVRFGALFAATPMLSARSVPPPVKVGLSAMLALILTPLVPVAEAESTGWLAVAVVKEAFVGLLLGWIATLVFSGVQMAGEWLDLQGGFQQGQVLNPAFDIQSAPLGSFTHMLAGLVFFASGGYALVVRAAATSLELTPPGSLALKVGTAGDWLPLVAKAVWLAVQLAAPVAAALFLAEVAIAVTNKAMPQMNVMMLSLPAKGLLAITALALATPIIARGLGLAFSDLGADLLGALRMLAG